MKKDVLVNSNYIPHTFNPHGDVTMSYLVWQPGRAVNSFIHHGKFVVMKTLSSCRALRCDKHQFHDKMMVSTSTVFELSLFEQMVVTKEER